ncbi:PREDICTED: serotransferrin-A-like [Thamnophis sirtalis]|uniref:Serotransferrin-A-like n=1 Tax=Thamnophis sirtalis TaxID=35019 RepID=A0A6I9YPY0_9SAUR|nr:PREDICTED: serotransferrin-A-like [Thamnophis sirtalis]
MNSLQEAILKMGESVTKGLEGVKNEMHEVRNNMGKIEERIGVIQTALQKNEQEIQNVKERTEIAEKRIDKVEDNLEFINSSLEEAILQLELERSAYYLRLQNVEEAKDENLQELIGEILGLVLDRPKKEVINDLDEVYRINTSFARRHRLPREIHDNKADAVSLDAGDVYSAVKLYGLTVVAKEIYLGGSCVFAVAVAKCGTLDIQRLKGVRSCHNGARWTSGWNIPMGFLLARSDLMWFSGRPLSEDLEREEYELLCPDGSTAPLTAYSTCNLGSGPGRAIVTRHNLQKTAKKFLKIIQHLFGIRGKEKARFELFTSAPFRGRDLLFHDATQNLQLLGEETEISQILGLDYVTLLQGLGHEGSSLSNSLVRWCCISDLELHKCEEWALNVRSDPLVCVQADSMIGCIELIKKNEADAVTLDATHAYFAETCTLAPVAAECYGEECAPTREELDLLTHVGGLPPLYSVALVRKANQQISRYTLRGKRSCHSHVYSPGGWLLLSQFTAGALEKGSSTCNLTSAYQNFFWKGCMPGANGNLCKVCIGQEGRVKGSSKCAANHHERYYGNLGALRCLLGDPTGRSFGDVALLEHHNLLQNIEYLTSSGWATGYSPGDFELLCPDGSRAAITAWRTCNLGCVPPSIVVTRPVTVTKVQDFLLKSQESSKNSFQLFESLRYGGNDLLFKDATQGLVFTGQLDFKSILGQSFFQLAQSVFSCTSAGILDFCELDTCTSSTQP